MATMPVPSNSVNTFRPPRPKRSCTHCGSEEIYRQRPRGIIERHVARAFNFFPYWCAYCDRRCYLRSRDSRETRQH
jgi:hypothetical protein